jgi:quinolinate synthase
MAMNGLAGLVHVLETGDSEVLIDAALGQLARRPIDRMLAFTQAQRAGKVSTGLVPHIGAA